MFHYLLNQTRTYDASGSITVGGSAFTAQSTDVLRFKLGRSGSTPLLDIDGTVNANGSLTTIVGTTAATYTLRLGQADIAALDPGIYDAEYSIVDDSETAPADAIKFCERGVVTVLSSLGGDVTLA